MVFKEGDGINGISLVDKNHVLAVTLSFGAR
jgi:hypothetical protein